MCVYVQVCVVLVSARVCRVAGDFCVGGNRAIRVRSVRTVGKQGEKFLTILTHIAETPLTKTEPHQMTAVSNVHKHIDRTSILTNSYICIVEVHMYVYAAK